MLQIADPKIIQSKIDTVPREKALQALQKKARHQAGCDHGGQPQAIDLSIFNAKAVIKSALSLVEEAKVALDDMELRYAAKRLHRCLRRAKKSLTSAWDHTQTASLANAGIRYASIAMVDVRARTVHGGLCTLQAQVLRVETCAQGH